MAKLDDFLQKKKETAPILDLSNSVANSKEELKRLLDRVPDFKIKPEKIPGDAIKIRDKGFKFKSSKKNLKIMKEPYLFMDPLPLEMKNLKISELAAVPIDWKMLTTLRPKAKVEENYFSRLVELGKLTNKSRTQEKRQFFLDPQIRKIKTKSGLVETRILNCSECGEDFCNGKTCSTFGYDNFARAPDLVQVTQKIITADVGKGEKIKKKIRRRKSRSKSRNRRKARSKSKSPSKNRKSSNKK